jgi:hypothetical protein
VTDFIHARDIFTQVVTMEKLGWLCIFLQNLLTFFLVPLCVGCRRYFYLIAFRSYLDSRVALQRSTFAGEAAFAAWMQARPELGHLCDNLKLKWSACEFAWWSDTLSDTCKIMIALILCHISLEFAGTWYTSYPSKCYCGVFSAIS